MGDTRCLSVLVVEDSADAAQSVADLLSLSGYDVRIADCGTSALREAGAAMPDVVLLDIGLPEMNGWVVATRLRELPSAKQPFVVAVTGYGDDGDRWRSADAGVDMHLVKPVDPDALLRLLAWVRDSLSGPSGTGAVPPPDRGTAGTVGM